MLQPASHEAATLGIFPISGVNPAQMRERRENEVVEPLAQALPEVTQYLGLALGLQPNYAKREPDDQVIN